ncbi:MAG: DUF4190 domain-containing protein [Actinobacteria bacterium]|nr:DUF4190 domain-containing protein [Actinomycetota bacterium]
MDEEKEERQGEEEAKEGEPGYVACLNCGKLMSSSAVFCNSCGVDLRIRQNLGTGTAAYHQWAAPPPGQGSPPPHIPGGPPPGYPPPYQQSAYPYPYTYPYQPPYRTRKTDEMAIISLVCALASFVILPFFPAVAAIALGFVSRQRIREGQGRLEGEGLALAGIIAGIFNVAICLGLLALALVLATRT